MISELTDEPTVTKIGALTLLVGAPVGGLLIRFICHRGQVVVWIGRFDAVAENLRTFRCPLNRDQRLR